jgi:hypothetical protein
MAAEDAIAALADYWDDVMSRLSADRAAELTGLINELGGTDRPRVVTRIADILVQALPRDHAVRRALVRGDLFQHSVTDLAVLSQVLRERANPTGSDALRAVTARLLEAPALTEEEVRQHGCDPDDPDLIRLERPDGARQWPEFQFTHYGAHAVVREINSLLGAENDPIGVGDWWLSRNGWLDDRPSRLIGTIPDERLVSAAAAVGLEV